MDYQVKIKRQNGNEEEYLVHYGVKGMKWGVQRRVRAAGRATANTIAHPIRTKAAITAMDARDGSLKAIRRAAIGRSTRELEEMNSRVNKLAKVKKSSGPQEKGPMGLKKSVKTVGSHAKNRVLHPLKYDAAISAMNARDGVGTSLRRASVGLTTREMAEVNNRVAGKKGSKVSKSNKSERITKAANKTVSKGKKSSGEKQLDAISVKYNSHIDQSDKLRKAASIARKSGNSEKAAELEKKAKSYRKRAERLFS